MMADTHSFPLRSFARYTMCSLVLAELQRQRELLHSRISLYIASVYTCMHVQYTNQREPPTLSISRSTLNVLLPPAAYHTHTLITHHTHHTHTHQECGILQQVSEALLMVGLEATASSDIDREGGGEGVGLQ